MSKQAIVTFTPLQPYFFGSELTHGDGGTNYFAKGNRLPQQSTLCGVLRHLLYETRHDRGLHSFTPSDAALNDYGDLLGLSPLFLSREEGGNTQYFLRQAMDRYQNLTLPRFALSANMGNNLFLTETTQRLIQQGDKLEETLQKKAHWQQAPVWNPPSTKTKQKQADAWVGQIPGTVVGADVIFRAVTRPGITKNRSGAPQQDEANFYKQTAYQLEKGWSFAVLANFRNGVDLNQLNGYCLPIGGEKTVFVINVHPEASTLEDLFPPNLFYQDSPPSRPTLVLTADTYIPMEAWPYIVTGVSSTVDFRHIRTHTGVRNFGSLQSLLPTDKPTDQHATLTKSTKYSLLQRGSVLVCENDADLTTLVKLLSIDPWRKIGFNHFFTYQ